MPLSVIQNSTITAPVKYRTVTTADSATLTAAVFTAGTIPVLPVTGTPNAFVAARLFASGDTIGVTPVALNIAADGTITILGFGLEVTLAAASPLVLTDGTIFYTPASIASTYGSKGSGPFAAGLVTHVAWLVTTAPTASHSTVLFAWLSG